MTRIRKTELKIKIKTLAAEAVIIKKEEQKWKKAPWHNPHDNAASQTHPMYFNLRQHRLLAVRRECRDASIAYGYLRSRTYRQIEYHCHESANWTNVINIVINFSDKKLASQEKKRDIHNAVRAWRDADRQQQVA